MDPCATSSGRRPWMKKRKLQSAAIFRVDPMIWGTVGRIFKMQTDLYNVKQMEAPPMFELSLCFPLLNKVPYFLSPFSQLPFRGVSNPY